MQCRHCGTEIADKAIICYRCGAATTDPTFKPPAPKRRRGWLLIVAAVLVALAIAAGVWLILTGDRTTGTRVPDRRQPRYELIERAHALDAGSPQLVAV